VVDQELEFDRAMGKLSTQDFEEMSGRLRARAVGIIKRLDVGSSAYRALIEKELAALADLLDAPPAKRQRRGSLSKGSPAKVARRRESDAAASTSRLWGDERS
jgi:hypothetical protein